MKDHFTTIHETNVKHHCVYCLTAFDTTQAYANHMKSEHDLPVWVDNRDDHSSIKPNHTAFSGSLKVYKIDLENSESFYLLEVLMRKKAETDSIVALNVNHSPHKTQLTAEVSLPKPILGSDQDERIRIFAMTNLIPIFVDGLGSDEISQMVEQMMLTVHNFASHGSGCWVVEKIDRLTLKAAQFPPIRPGTYLALSLELKDRFVLDIRNKDDRCFAYCYTAAYHLKFGPELTPQNSWWKKQQQQTYDESNLMAKQPDGDFDYRMPLNQISRFERLNRVQVNVFR